MRFKRERKKSFRKLQYTIAIHPKNITRKAEVKKKITYSRRETKRNIRNHLIEAYLAEVVQFNSHFNNIAETRIGFRSAD